MLRGVIISVFLLTALASVMSSVASRVANGSSDAPTGDETVIASERAGEGGDIENLGDDAIALERESDGHFYADVEINGQIVHMLVDTGATVIALSREDAQSVGLANSIGMPDVVGEGASGVVRGEVVSLDSVSLGPKSAENMTAVVLDGGSQSLLGQSFLSEFDSVGIHGDTMVLQ